SQPVDDDDLRPVKFRVINPEQLKNGDKITLAVDSNAVRLWRSRDKQPLQLSYTVGTDVIPTEFFAEGYQLGSAKITATISNAAGVKIHYDFIRVFVTFVDLTAYRPHTEGPNYGNPFPR